MKKYLFPIFVLISFVFFKTDAFALPGTWPTPVPGSCSAEPSNPYKYMTFGTTYPTYGAPSRSTLTNPPSNNCPFGAHRMGCGNYGCELDRWCEGWVVTQPPSAQWWECDQKINEQWGDYSRNKCVRLGCPPNTGLQLQQDECTCCAPSCPLPSCPAGSSTNNTGPYCQFTQSQTCNTCGTSSSSRTCWSNETNYAPPAPPTIEYCVANATNTTTVCTAISTNAAAPTVLAIPAATSVVYFRVGTVAIPANSNSRGMQYLVNVNSQTTNPVFNCATDTSDYCDTWSSLNRSKADLRNRIGIAGSRNYEIIAKSRTINRCNDNAIESAASTLGYVRFQSAPSGFAVTPNIGVSGTETDTDNGPACTDNNPQVYTATYQDVDGCADLRKAGFWISSAAAPAHTSPSDLVVAGRWEDSVYPTVGGIPAAQYGRVELVNGNWVSYEGTGGSPASRITPIATTCINANTLQVQWRVTYTLGTKENRSMNIFMYAYDSKGAMTGWTDTGDWLFDNYLPTPTFSGINTINANTLELVWSVDESVVGVGASLAGYAGLSKYFGDARLESWGIRNGPIYDTNAGSGGINPYQIFDPATSIINGAITYNSYNTTWNDSDLWKYTSPASNGRERINILNNQGGSIRFDSAGVDKACNMATATNLKDMGEPWLTTRGGLVYSLGNSTMNTLRFTSENTPLTTDPMWNYDIYRTQRNELDLGSELVFSGGTIRTTTPLLYGYKLQSYQNDNIGDWYLELSSLLAERIRLYGNDFKDISKTDVSISGSVSSYLGASGDVNLNNVVRITPSLGNKVIFNSNFVCDMRTLFLVNGNIEIQPNITRSGANDNGCIFVASGDIIFGAGTFQSVGRTVGQAPKYDLVEGYFISQGKIDIQFVDEPEVIRDGLKVHGGLVAMGNGSTKGIFFNRSLQLTSNLLYPTEVIHADPRYANLAGLFFGPVGISYVKDTGLKN